MGRLVALAVAVLVVLGAVLARRALDDGAEGGDAGPPTVICAPEVAAACAGLDDDDEIEVVAVEAAGVTADRLRAGDDLGAAGWLVAGPWPEIAGVGELSDPLATGQAAIYVRPDRAEALAAACEPPRWVCVEDVADRPWAELGGEPGWGDVRVGLPPIDTTAGLVTAAVAVADQLGRDDYATNDLVDDTADFLGRLARADATPPAGLSPLESMARVPGSVDVVGALTPEATGLPADRVVLAGPPGPATVGVVLAGDPDAFDLDALSAALGATGWTGPQEGVRATGLPGPDVMEGVRDAWKAAGG